MQHAATYVLDEPPDVRGTSPPAAACTASSPPRRTRGSWRRAPSAAPPTGAFYLYPDLEPLRPALAAQGVSTGAQLAALLLERHDVAVLEGEAFGDDPAALRFRMATSLLYGAATSSAGRRSRADDPVALPWIAAALERLGEALRALRG